MTPSIIGGVLAVVFYWLVFRPLLVLAYQLYAGEKTMRNPFKKRPTTPALIDMTAKLVADGAPELPNGVKYEYNARTESLHLTYGAGTWGKHVEMRANDDDVRDAFMAAANWLYDKIKAEVAAEKRREAKLQYATSQKLPVIGEKREWIDDAS